MVSCYLMGGLGNQLFQIASGYALSREIHSDFGIDINQGHFTQKPALNYNYTVYYKINKIDLNSQKFSYIYNEPFFNYKKIPITNDILIKGYFQSEKYFDKYYDEVYDLIMHNYIVNNLKKAFSLINSLSLHVRRGDYLNKPNFHTNLPIDYYIEAIKYIDSKDKIDKIYVFSDDIKWCKENFTDNRMIYIDNLEDYEELYLMSLCSHNIIANSSFSWWGSYLNLNKNKIVIAPKNWFGKEFSGNWQDIYYKNNIIL
jgi:hypothetical protein